MRYKFRSMALNEQNGRALEIIKKGWLTQVPKGIIGNELLRRQIQDDFPTVIEQVDAEMEEEQARENDDI